MWSDMSNRASPTHSQLFLKVKLVNLTVDLIAEFFIRSQNHRSMHFVFLSTIWIFKPFLS